MLGLLLFLRLESPKREKLSLLKQIKQLDPAGILFFVPSMVCLILALQWGGTTYPWSAPKIIGLLVTFGILFVIFIVIEVLTPETAMAPTRVVLNRSIGSAMLFIFLLMGSMMSIVYYLTIWFQAVKGDSALKSGISTIPLVLSLVLTSIISGIIVQKVGYYVPAMLIAPLLSAPGAGLLSTLSPTSNHKYWIGYQVLYSCGVGFAMQTSNLAAQNVLPRADVPIGISLMFFMQQLGGSVFLSVSQNLFTSRLIGKLSGIAGLDGASIVNTGATNLRKVVPLNELGVVVDAYNSAISRVFLLAAILSASMLPLALVMQWKSIKGRPKDTEAKQNE
jgi:hypothetical protein